MLHPSSTESTRRKRLCWGGLAPRRGSKMHLQGKKERRIIIHTRKIQKYVLYGWFCFSAKELVCVCLRVHKEVLTVCTKTRSLGNSFSSVVRECRLTCSHFNIWLSILTCKQMQQFKCWGQRQACLDYACAATQHGHKQGISSLTGVGYAQQNVCEIWIEVILVPSAIPANVLVTTIHSNAPGLYKPY